MSLPDIVLLSTRSISAPHFGHRVRDALGDALDDGLRNQDGHFI
jgi:hypothetical protein